MSMTEVAERYGQLFKDVDKAWLDLVAAHDQAAAGEGDKKSPAPSIRFLL